MDIISGTLDNDFILREFDGSLAIVAKYCVNECVDSRYMDYSRS